MASGACQRPGYRLTPDNRLAAVDTTIAATGVAPAGVGFSLLAVFPFGTITTKRILLHRKTCLPSFELDDRGGGLATTVGRFGRNRPSSRPRQPYLVARLYSPRGRCGFPYRSATGGKGQCESRFLLNCQHSSPIAFPATQPRRRSDCGESRRSWLSSPLFPCILAGRKPSASGPTVSWSVGAPRASTQACGRWRIGRGCPRWLMALGGVRTWRRYFPDGRQAR
jgi:hypothetical protein